MAIKSQDTTRGEELPVGNGEGPRKEAEWTSSMEVDVENSSRDSSGVVFRRDSGTRRPLSLAR